VRDGRGLGVGEDGAGEACGEGAFVFSGGGASWLAAAGADSGASRMAEGLADGEGAGKADGGGATGLGVTLDAVSGAAAARWPPPRVTVSAMPIPVRARTPAKTATPDRKLISSMRAFITRLSLPDQPVPSLTTKHDTWVSGVSVGSG
jgi:hypothetical protein